VTTTGVFGRAPLQELHQRVMPNAFSSSNSNSEKNLELGVNSWFFLELLKGCSKNTCYGLPHGVGVKLPTNATLYTTYRFTGKESTPPPGAPPPPCASPLSPPSLQPPQTVGAPSEVCHRRPHLSCGMDSQDDDLPSSTGIVA